MGILPKTERSLNKQISRGDKMTQKELDHVKARLRLAIDQVNEEKQQQTHVFAKVLPIPQNDIERNVQANIRENGRFGYCLTCKMYHKVA
jgi:hypothetical protein